MGIAVHLNGACHVARRRRRIGDPHKCVDATAFRFVLHMIRGTRLKYAVERPAGTPGDRYRNRDGHSGLFEHDSYPDRKDQCS